MADDERMECARHCLRALPVESARLLLAYYEDDKGKKIANRQELANQLGVSPNTLRMRLRRIRVQLEQCIIRCEKRKSGVN